MALPMPLTCSQRVKEVLAGTEQQLEMTTSMANIILAPVKTERQILENSMLEDDPNANCAVTQEEKTKPRWGPQHKGAQELANLYSTGRTALHYACSTGNLDVVKTLIQHVMLQVDISSDHYDRNEAVLLADAACQSFECLQLLLDNGIDINAHDSNGFTAVHLAAAKGEGLDNLQRASSTLDPNMVTEDGYSPLFIAALFGFSEVVQQLIKMGAEVNGLKENPLHLSCLNGDVVLVLILLRAGSNANAFSNGTTPIFCTGLDQIDYNFAIVTVEIRNRIDQRRLAQMHLGCNKEDCLKTLIAFGGNVNARMETSKSTALHLFASKKQVNMMKILLDASAEVDVKNCYGQTPLHLSCIVGCETTVKLLLQYNSKADIIDDFGKTPLAWASEKNHVAIMTLLLNSVNCHQANLETFTTPLLASCLASLEAVQLLLENGADVNMPSNVEKPISYDSNKFHIEEQIIKYSVNLPCREIKAANERWSKPLYEITPLSLATVLGNTDLVKLLLKFGANPNHVETNGWSSFFFAYPLIVDISEDFSNCHNVVKELLKYGALPNGWNDQYSPLVLAAANRNKNLFQFFIKHGADLDQLCTVVEDGVKMTALHITCFCRDAYDFSQELIKAGASINALDSQGQIPLHLAASADNVDVLPLLTQSYLDVEDASGNTALMLASSINVIEFLVEAGHDVNIANKLGHAPIHLWAENGNADIVQILLDAGAHVNYKTNTGDTPLAFATIHGHVAIVELLCQHGADPEIADCFGDTPLHHASELGTVEIVKILCEKVTEEIRNNFGFTPLHQAAVGGHVGVCQMLLDLQQFEKVEIDAQAQNGVTPLKLAALKGHVDVVKWLVGEGAEVDLADNHGNTGLFAAAAMNHVDVVMFLHKNGARIHVVDDDGYTPLHDAAVIGMLDSAKYLIENGADLTFANLEGKTPLDLAIENGQNKIVELIAARVLPLD